MTYVHKICVEITLHFVDHQPTNMFMPFSPFIHLSLPHTLFLSSFHSSLFADRLLAATVILQAHSFNSASLFVYFFRSSEPETQEMDD